jgi:hypothetical protein
MFKNKRNLCCGLLLTVMSINSYALENGSDSAALGAEGAMAGNLPLKVFISLLIIRTIMQTKCLINMEI